MDNARRGKFFLLHLLLVFYFQQVSWVVAESNLDSIESDGEQIQELSVALDLLNRYQFQLEKLEELVQNLTELVSRLESKFSGHSNLESLVEKEEKFRVNVEVERAKIDDRDQQSVEHIPGKDFDINVKDVEKVGAVSVTKLSNSFWSERFQLVSAVKLGSNATCINVLPFGDFEGFVKYVAVGDDLGRVYVLSRNGDVSVEFHTMSESPITAILSYLSIYKNESILVTGHENGLILMHRIWEDSNADEWSSLHMASVLKFDRHKVKDTPSPITILEVHHVGQKRYILSTDLSGTIRVFRENGTVYGQPVVPMSRPLAFLKQRLLFLTEMGAGSLDLRTMKIREAPCEGLNNSVVENYVFDATERSKAYGFTSEGDMIHVLLLGDIMNFKCRIRSKRKFEMGKPQSFQAIKGYLLAGNHEKIFVYNVSSQHYVRAGGPKLLSSADLNEIASSFLSKEQMSANGKRKLVKPIIASDREKLVILTIGSGYLGIYRSTLPVFKNEFNTMQWTSPILFFILFLFGAWHFFANKKEALTSWGPDDPFTTSASVTNGGVPVGGSSSSGGTSSGDTRPFIDSSRNADIGDLRGTVIRGPSRRYVSPSQYPGGSAASSFRPSAADGNSVSADPNFRTAPEIKYRGPNLENSGFPKRREASSLYVNNAVADDNN